MPSTANSGYNPAPSRPRFLPVRKAGLQYSVATQSSNPPSSEPSYHRASFASPLFGNGPMLYSRKAKPMIICPFRLLERLQIFHDCVHLLKLHEPGNELRIVAEVAVPGGSVDYCLVSVRD